MDTFPIIFPAPSPALVELAKTSHLILFAKAWRLEVSVQFNGFRVMPSLPLCSQYYEFIRGEDSLEPCVVHDTEDARRLCAVDPSKAQDWATLPARFIAARLVSAGLR